MTKHTPGPWSVDPTRFGYKKPSINGARIVASSGLQIGSVTSTADKPIYQKEADACLFAAAPDLLATLRWLHNKGGLGLDVHDRLRLVLARAEPASSLTQTAAGHEASGTAASVLPEAASLTTGDATK